MHHTRIKICGVRDLGTAQVAVEAGADAIGLVFVEGSARQVSVAEARAIVRNLPAFVEVVALFVDAPAQRVTETSRALGVRTIQLHGHETPAYAQGLAPLRVIKAITFEPRHVSESLAPWRGTCDNLAAVLFDAAPSRGRNQGLPGGTGEVFDWDALATLRHGGLLAGLGPLVLAGGLTAQNVGRAIEILAPYAVDVSSGVESEPGVKDARLINEFCQAVREAGR